MVDSILSGNRESILNMYIYEQIFDNWSTMGMVKLLYYFSLSSHIENFSSLFKWVPFIFEQILQSAIVVSHCFMENIFIIDVSSCWTPSEFIIDSDW